MSNLAAIAQQIVAPYKGILAADESTSTIKARFDKVSLRMHALTHSSSMCRLISGCAAQIDVENIEANRQAYRQLLFTTEGATPSERT